MGMSVGRRQVLGERCEAVEVGELNRYGAVMHTEGGGGTPWDFPP